MVILRMFILFLCVLAVTGCAAKSSYYSQGAKNGSSTLEGDYANLVRFFSKSEAHVFLDQIDGKTVRANKAYVTEGEHTIRITAHNMGVMSEIELPLTFKPDRKYKITATKVGGVFTVQLLDITEGTPILISSHEGAATGDLTEVILPVMILSQ